jgi:hypothetical protein
MGSIPAPTPVIIVKTHSVNMRNNEIDLAKIQNLAAHRDIICFLLHDKKYQGSKTV